MHRPFRRTAALAAVFTVLAAASWPALQACSIAASDLIATVDRRPLLASLRDTVLIPRSERLVAEALVLEAAAKNLAAAPDPILLDSAKSAWKNASLAWAALQAMRFGPIADQSPSLNFWPTRPNLIQQNLSASDPLDSNRMATVVSSAAKGFPGLEWLLFASSPDSTLAALTDAAKGPRRCRYLAAVATDIRRTAEKIRSEWKGNTGTSLVDPASGARFPTTQAALQDMIVGLISSLEEMKNSKVLTPAGAGAKGNGRPQPDAVESPYAGLSLDILRANLEGVESAFKGQGPLGQGTGLDTYLKDLGSDLPARIEDDIARSKEALAAVPAPLSSAVTGQAAKVKALGTSLTNLVVVVKNEVASTLGLTITFTDSDGD